MSCDRVGSGVAVISVTTMQKIANGEANRVHIRPAVRYRACH